MPNSDFQLYKSARRLGQPYREFMIRHGRRWLKKKGQKK